jgi:hypothetical protein
MQGMHRAAGHARYAVVTMLLASMPLNGCGQDHPSGDASKNSAGRNGAVVMRANTQDSAGVIQHLSGLQKAHFAFLRSVPEGLPPAVEATLRQPAYGANWRLAQQLKVMGRGRIWVLPARESICLVTEELRGAIGLTCTAVTEAVRHGLFSASLSRVEPARPYPQRLVVGIVSDKVHRVQVETPGFKPRIVDVVRNTFVLRDSIMRPPESLKLLATK